jgi:cell division protein FtsZ
LFEGNKRIEKAENGIAELKENVDTLIVVPNQKLISLVPKNYPLEEAFRVADEILFHATKGISDVINVPGLVNVDFADVRTVMSQMGDALMGSGVGSGENRAKEAAEQAISSPLIDDVSILGALGVLVNITGGKDLSLNDITEATTVIHQAAGEDANIIFGAVKDLSLNGDLRVTVIATGFHRDGIRSGLYRQKSRKISYQSNERRTGRETTCSEFEKDILEQVMGEVVGHDGNLSFESKDDLSIPTFIRKQMD